MSLTQNFKSPTHHPWVNNKGRYGGKRAHALRICLPCHGNELGRHSTALKFVTRVLGNNFFSILFNACLE